jgi:hypothetical protein
MKKIAGYLREYVLSLNKGVFLFSTFYTAIAILINYRFGLNKAIGELGGLWPYLAWYAVFLFSFAFGYWMAKLFSNVSIFPHRKAVLFLLLAPAIFAWKMTYSFSFHFSSDTLQNEYWRAVVYWPLKVIVISGCLFLVHHLFDRSPSFYGVTLKNFTAKPYLVMLLIMVPLIAIAATQNDFQRMYPRMQTIEYLMQPGKGFQKLLYELSYGSDFFSIELFFRGFLVLAFAKWVGKEAILPMAIFYCTIHFGKPLGECISSFFGGIILGVVSHRTGSILGGFLVHVGIAWLMELGGYVYPLFA